MAHLGIKAGMWQKIQCFCLPYSITYCPPSWTNCPGCYPWLCLGKAGQPAVEVTPEPRRKPEGSQWKGRQGRPGLAVLRGGNVAHGRTKRTWEEVSRARSRNGALVGRKGGGGGHRGTIIHHHNVITGSVVQHGECKDSATPCWGTILEGVG